MFKLSVVSKVGKKGELVLKKSVREKAGIHPGDYVIMTSKKNEIIIKKIESIEDFFKMPKLIKISKGELTKLRRKIHKEMEATTLDEP